MTIPPTTLFALLGQRRAHRLERVGESRTLTSPIALTNTHSVGVVRDALVAAQVRERDPQEPFWRTPVVGETRDGILNGQHVNPARVDAALASATGGRVESAPDSRAGR